MYRRVLIQIQCFTVAMMILFFSQSPVFAVAEPPEIKAPSAILMEVQRGQILYQKNPKLKLHVSCANKIMTDSLLWKKCRIN